MGNYEQLKQAVSDVIKTNGNQEITGEILQNTLLSIISTVGKNATFAGIATPTTNPGTPDGPVFYIATQAGTYSNFAGATLNNPGMLILYQNSTGNWLNTKVYECLQELGNNSNYPMSQNAVTSNLITVTGYYAGEIIIDNVNNTIRNSGGVVFYTNGTRSQSIATRQSSFNAVKKDSPTVITFDTKTLLFGYYNANNEEIVNKQNIIVFGGILSVKNVFCNISKVTIDGKTYVNNRVEELFHKYVFAVLGEIEIDINKREIIGKNNVVVFNNGTRGPFGSGKYSITGEITGTNTFILFYKNNSFDIKVSSDLSLDEYIVASFVYSEGRIISVSNNTVACLSINGITYVNNINTLENNINTLENNINTLENNINTLENKIDAPYKGMTLYDDVRDFSSGFNIKGFNITDKTLISDSNNSVACYTKRFISDYRKAQFIIKVPTQNGVVRVGSLQNESIESLLYSTCCEVDFLNREIRIYRGGGSNGIQNLQSIYVSEIKQDITNQQWFILEVSRDRRITTFRLINYYKQYVDIAKFDGSNVRFDQGAGNHRPFYFIYTNIPNVTVTRLSIFGAYNVFLAHIGDSLSESNGRADAKDNVGTNWIEQVMDKINWNGSIVAQSGMGSRSVIDALNNEVKFMKPKILSVMIGTNGGVTDEQIIEFKKFADDNGIPYIQHHIPVTDGREPTAPNSSQYIAAQLDRLGILGARMDVATALNGNISDGYNPECFSSDKIHTNQLGNNKMKVQFFIDLPQFQN